MKIEPGMLCEVLPCHSGCGCPYHRFDGELVVVDEFYRMTTGDNGIIQGAWYVVTENGENFISMESALRLLPPQPLPSIERAKELEIS